MLFFKGRKRNVSITPIFLSTIRPDILYWQIKWKSLSSSLILCLSHSNFPLSKIWIDLACYGLCVNGPPKPQGIIGEIFGRWLDHRRNTACSLLGGGAQEKRPVTGPDRAGCRDLPPWLLPWLSASQVPQSKQLFFCRYPTACHPALESPDYRLIVSQKKPFFPLICRSWVLCLSNKKVTKTRS